MFDSDLGRDEEALKTKRRVFLFTSLSALAGMILWSLRKSKFVQSKASSAPIREVTIVEFSDSGERLKTVHVSEGCQDGRGMAEAAVPRRFRDNPSCRH
jgi:hypothetical protein